MLSKTLLINPLASNITNQLRLVDDFYVCTTFTKDMIGAPIVRIDENIYYRFMNFIYLPQPTESLSTEQVIKICDLRLEYFDKLVDRQLNSYVVDAVADCIAAEFADAAMPLKALDFGCGSGLSSQLLLAHMPKLDIVGVDISEKAISCGQEQGINAILTVPGEPLPFEAATFDLIFAVFVMHFNIDMPTLIELRRVLQPSGLFVFNVYQRDIEALTEQLQEAGFRSINIWRRLLKIGDSHMIISCGVFPNY